MNSLLNSTGERYLPWSKDVPTGYEHIHRYLFAGQYVEGKCVLDISSGEGYGTAILAKMAKTVVGVDIDATTVAHARKHHPDKNIYFVRADAQSFALAPNSIDVVVSFETIEHFEAHDTFLSAIKSALSPGGLLIISTPNRRSYSDETNYDNPFHKRELYRDEFLALLRKYFQHVHLHGQRLIASSLIAEATGDFFVPPNNPVDLLLSKIDNTTLEYSAQKTSQLEPLYYIALCSDSPLPSMSSNLLLDNNAELLNYFLDLHQRLADTSAQVEHVQLELHQRLAEASTQAEHGRALLAEKVHELAITKANVAALEAQWVQVQGTVSWAVAERLKAARERVAPRGSARWRLWSSSVHGVRTWRREGPAVLERKVYEKLRVRSASRVGTLDEADEETPAIRRTNDVWANSRLRSFLASGIRLSFPLPAQPVVTIVIPTFNKAHYTYVALESLLAHTVDVPFELIVVDNGSTDDTLTLIERLDNVRVHRNEHNFGFGDACNVGAGMGRGEYVCFLNNDTVVTAGWLDALVQTISIDQRIGAVGAQLIHPDGNLQEAGSILWRDGSAIGYGRGDDPLSPEYGYVRDVDFCSAACLLVRRDIFSMVGGFDERYAPAYYEDADLCLAIWRAGLRVVYQPRAIVYHHEFGSGDRKRAIELQLANRAKFVEKWMEQVAEREKASPARLFFARDRRPGRRILVIDDRVPLSRFGSGSPRTRAMLDALVALDAVVTFLPIGDTTPYEPITTELEQIGIEVLHSITDVQAIFRQRSDVYEAAIVSRPNNAWCVDTLKGINSDVAVVYDAEAVFALRDIRQARHEGNQISDQAAGDRIAAEVAITAAADAVLTVTETEQRLFLERNSNTPIFVWGTAISRHTNAAKFESRRNLLFVGNLSTPPNDDAVRYLLKDIFPKITVQVSGQLVVAGMNPSPSVRDAASAFPDRISLAGFLEDLTTSYDTSRVFLAPHRFAAGIPLKVVEAMANGVPCVISQLLGEMLDIEDGHQAMVANDADEFAAKVMRVYKEPELWYHIQQGGYNYVQERFDPTIARETLRECLEEAISRTRRRKLSR